MHDFITPKHKIEKELLVIDSYLQTTLSTSPSDLQAHGDEIEAIGNITETYLSRAGTLLADAKYHLNEKLQSDILVTLIEQMKGTFLSASVQKEFIRSACVYETWLVDMAERLNRSCTHKLDWYRSLLSRYKEEIKLHYK